LLPWKWRLYVSPKRRFLTIATRRHIPEDKILNCHHRKKELSRRQHSSIYILFLYGEANQAIFDQATAHQHRIYGNWLTQLWRCRCKRLSSPPVLKHVLAASWDDSESCYPGNGGDILPRNEVLTRATRLRISEDNIVIPVIGRGGLLRWEMLMAHCIVSRLIGGWVGCQLYTSAALCHQKFLLKLGSVWVWVNTRALVPLGELDKLNNSVTSGMNRKPSILQRSASTIYATAYVWLWTMLENKQYPTWYWIYALRQYVLLLRVLRIVHFFFFSFSFLKSALRKARAVLDV
jgi:hypothetical protein